MIDTAVVHVRLAQCCLCSTLMYSCIVCLLCDCACSGVTVGDVVGWQHGHWCVITMMQSVGVVVVLRGGAGRLLRLWRTPSVSTVRSLYRPVQVPPLSHLVCNTWRRCTPETSLQASLLCTTTNKSTDLLLHSPVTATHLALLGRNITTSSTVCSNMPPTTKPSSSAVAPENIDQLIASNHVVIFTMEGCKFCTSAKKILDDQNVLYREVILGIEGGGLKLYEALQKKVNKSSVPQIFVGGKSIGGSDELLAKDKEGTLMPLIRGHNYEYDLIVIGGGSGGLAASKVRHCACMLFIVCLHLFCYSRKPLHSARRLPYLIL